MKPSFLAYTIKKEYDEEIKIDKLAIKLYLQKISYYIKAFVIYFVRLWYYLFKLIFDYIGKLYYKHLWAIDSIKTTKNCKF